MKLRINNSIAIAFILSICFITQAFGQDTNDDRQLGVAMRSIGHEVLLSLGDSTSRVLPIINDENQYRIQFETEFEFDPEIMAKTIDSVMLSKDISKHYVVEIEQVDSNLIVHSYLIEPLPKKGIMACSQRALLEGKYDIIITLLDRTKTQKTTEFNKPASALPYGKYLLAFLSLLLVGYFVYRYFTTNETVLDENTIEIGSYLFDTNSMELKYNNGITIELTSKEANLLMLLHESANKTVERENILKSVWGDEGDYIGRTLDVFISKLRKKLEHDSNIKIVNTRGVGYKLVVSKS